MLNTTELRRALDMVLDASAMGLHDQVDWIRRFDCGTGGCFAGTYALGMGCTPVWWGDDEITDVVREPGGDTKWMVSDWVRRELGLTEQQAVLLFSASNTTADLKDIVDELCESAVDG